MWCNWNRQDVRYRSNYRAYKSIGTPKLLYRKKVVITAGATKEDIDPVRFLSCKGSGKMGYALAKVARDMGAIVTLVAAVDSSFLITSSNNITLLTTKSAEDMERVVNDVVQDADIFIAAAAVADYKPITYSSQKIKKETEYFNIELRRNPDIISSVKEKYPHIVCVGFAAETEKFEAYGIQ